MTREDAAIVASRSLAMRMAVWTLVELTELPEWLLSLMHHLGQQSVLGTRDYWTSYYSVVLALHVIRVLVTSLAGAWFWKGGPLPDKLFAGTIETERIETGS
jgi:hypothetical protein